MKTKSEMTRNVPMAMPIRIRIRRTKSWFNAGPLAWTVLRLSPYR